MGGETGLALVLNLLVFKSICDDLLGVPILLIFSLLHSLCKQPIPGLFAEDISKQYPDMYITASHNDFGTYLVFSTAEIRQY